MRAPKAVPPLPMDDRAELLRRRIALYRRYLREGASLSAAELYLQQLKIDEAELMAIASEGQPGDGGSSSVAAGRKSGLRAGDC